MFKKSSKKVNTIFNTVIIAMMIINSDCYTTYNENTSPQINLELLSEIKVQAWASGSNANVFIDGSHIFIGQGYPGLTIFDISNPRAPKQILSLHSTSFPSGAQPGPIVASKNRIFVATPSHDNIQMLDRSNLLNPVILKTFGNIPEIEQLAIIDNYIYVFAGSSTAYKGGVYVYDIAPVTPVMVGYYLVDLVDPGFYINQEKVVFLARRPLNELDCAKIDVVDMKDPEHPNLLYQWKSDFTGNINDIYQKGDKLYCSAYWGGLWILDIKEYGHINLISRFDWNDSIPYALSVKSYPPFVFIAASGSSQAYWKFVVFLHEQDVLSVEREIPVTSPPLGTYLKNDLLFLIQKDSDWGPPYPRRHTLNPVNESEHNKTIQIYRLQIKE